MKKFKIFELFAVVAIVGLVSVYKFIETHSKRLVLETFNNTNEVVIEMSANTIKVSNMGDIDKLRNLLDVGSWNQLIYYNKKSFPVISIMFDEIDIGIYQDEDTVNVSYGSKINHYKVKREIKNELTEFIKVH
ncbi:MAG TPA: hypothetical protein DCL31_06480 [Clostridium sp.]|nr:hypothetical protein [Clostridium sp.]